MESGVYSWSEVVRKVRPGLASGPARAELATVVTYARNFGIGTPVSQQRAEYTPTHLDDLLTLLKWWDIALDGCNVSNISKEATRALVRSLAISITGHQPVPFLAIFCPSYKVGPGRIGFEQTVGPHTIDSLTGLALFLRRSTRAGMPIVLDAYFSDLLLENYDLLKGTDYRTDLSLNYESFRATLDEFGVRGRIQKLSVVPDLAARVSESGTQKPTAKRTEKLFNQVYLRNKVFYGEYLGWSDERIIRRTEVLYDSYAEMGHYFRQKNPQYVIYWTESAYERAPLYSTALDPAHPFPVIYGRKQ